jgi:mono/diheme cytochrome c family protein
MRRRSASAWRGRGVARPLALGVAVVGLAMLIGWGGQANASRAHSSTSRSLIREGAQVLADSGCLACHLLGSQGNDGPGPNLTTIGARLSAAAITRALDHPRQPMPSFEALPPAQHRALVAYLVSLKAPSDVIPPPSVTAPGGRPHAPSVIQRRAIEQVIAALYRALKHHEYQAACQQYEPALRPLLILAAQNDFQRPSIHSCAQALKALASAKGAATKLAAARPLHVDGITITGKTANVAVSEPTAHGVTFQTLTLVYGSHGWKIGASVN